ncbi:MAG TPA: hypothetical protein VLC09_05425 [Polyangiaceae bacterium]|nr:hypothetical protein [Polyangiaceae bacterium]
MASASPSRAPSRDATPERPQDAAEVAAQAAERRVHRLYLLVAALLVLGCANLFFGSLKLQTEHVGLWFDPQAFDQAVHGMGKVRWSAPLDDVFIHFDFARATARGYPFEWSEGNGYSSGGTSLLYPFVLAAGYWIGYRGFTLMVWAGVVACVCTLATLLSVERMFGRLTRFARLLCPAVFLSTGVLDWSLFSGMEVALFLAIWGFCFWLWDELLQLETLPRWAPLGLGVASALLVGTRPESALLVGVFGGWLAWHRFRKDTGLSRLRRWLGAASDLLLIGTLPVVVLLGHMIANKLLTGDSSAAGALAKLELHHPYLTRGQAFDAWLFHIAYQVRRVAEYHLSAVPYLGYVVWLLGLVPLFFEKTRKYAVLLWISIVLWIVTVALNGQVRWQNERYTMPSLAWLLLAVALGLGAVIDWALREPRPRPLRRWMVLAPVALAMSAFVGTELLRFREQVWFFGRASRNILEQHIRTGEFLRQATQPRPRRVLVSDAGAIPYVSDLPAFDLIGLGGYEGLPIARASRQGVGAAVELIEHLSERNRPDVMALYPSWWGTFLLWFGRPVHEFPVRGNVICGGASKVVYDPDWSSLRGSATPFAAEPGSHLVDSLDFADLLSERPHGFLMSQPAVGYVDMKLLPHPKTPDRDLWDAGRLLVPSLEFSFDLAATAQPGRLYLRVAPARPARLELTAPGLAPVVLTTEARDAWVELEAPWPAGNGKRRVTLRMLEGDLHLYHLFVVTSPAGPRPDTQAHPAPPAP